MAGQRDEELRMTPRLSTSPEPKRSKPWENSGIGGEIQQTEESAEVKNRRLRRELMAAAAEKRLAAVKSDAPMVMKNVECVKDVKITEMPMEEAEVDPTTEMKSVEEVANVNVVSFEGHNKGKSVDKEKVEPGSGASYTLSATKADQLFLMIFGSDVSKNVLTQWCNQGISFSPDPETLMGLVQHEGGPCGVLAAIQAFVLKYLIFSAEGSDNATQNMPSRMSIGNVPNNESVAPDIFSSLSTAKRSRALIRSMTEILFLCGHNERAVIASLNIVDGVKSSNGSEDEFIGKALGSLYIESGSDLQKALAVDTCTSMVSAVQKLEAMLPIFRSRYGALLFLISALLSRGLDNVQEDRDDPSQSLVTAPFGHASQEIVNLLLSGCAVANVFDGRMDLGGGMFVKGISTSVEVGFLTLLESLNFCKVGHYLKCPRWPIWVVGSESHYTVLFALDTRVQEENELENRESRIRRAFDSQDQSGGGGFISVEGFQRVIHETGINFPPEKVEHLCGMGFIVWSEFWQALLELDKSSGGVKDSTGLMGKKVFDLYHFNGIAKSVSNGGQGYGNESPIQRPRLTKLRVSVPPKWTPEEFMADVPPVTSDGGVNSGESAKPPQHAPLVDCIRTRWPRAVCNWEGDAPSIV